MPPAEYRFYASEYSYFSAKVRPALRYKRLPFAELLPTPDAYRNVIRARTGLSFIPVIITPRDEAWQDTSDMLDALEERYPEPPLYPRTPVQRVVALLWELYADEFLVIPALHYRWSFPESEEKARADFASFAGDAATADRFADRMKGFTPMMGIQPATIPVIESHTLELLDRFSELLAAQPYLLGRRPSLADCALMGPLYAHLYLDAVPGRLLRQRALRVCQWVERMNHPDPDDTGAWLPGDALAPELRPLLELIGRDALPVLLDDVRAFEEWADAQAPDAELPRGVGMHETTLRGVSFPRYTSPYTLWMVQRPLDAFRALTASQQRTVRAAVDGTGCEALLDFQPRHRLGKKQFKLAFEKIGA